MLTSTVLHITAALKHHWGIAKFTRVHFLQTIKPGEEFKKEKSQLACFHQQHLRTPNTIQGVRSQMNCIYQAWKIYFSPADASTFS